MRGPGSKNGLLTSANNFQHLSVWTCLHSGKYQGREGESREDVSGKLSKLKNARTQGAEGWGKVEMREHVASRAPKGRKYSRKERPDEGNRQRKCMRIRATTTTRTNSRRTNQKQFGKHQHKGVRGQETRHGVTEGDGKIRDRRQEGEAWREAE